MESVAHDWARSLLDAPGRLLPLALQEPQAPPLVQAAWAFKDLCYAAWSTAPSRARPCAERVEQLLSERPDDGELQALAAWTAGIAALAEGRMPDALSRLDVAHDAFDGIGHVQHAGQTLVPKMVALAMLGHDDQALQAGEHALKLFTRAGDSVAAGKVELNLGTLLARRDRHAEAAQQYRRAAVRFARSGALEMSVLADVGLANALTWQFDFAEAGRITRRALMRAQTHGLRMPEALARVGLGRQELLAGRLHRALRELVCATRLMEEAGAAPQQQLEADTALADTYMAVNMLPEAVALYDRLEQRALEMGAPVERARVLLERSRAYARLARPEPARADLENARDLFQRAGNQASEAGTDIALAIQHLLAGRAEQALASAGQALKALAGSGITGWLLEARALEASALALLARDDDARWVFEQLLPEAQTLPAVALSCHLGLARLAWKAGAAGPARHHADAALMGVEEARATLPADEFRAAVSAAAEDAQALWLDLALASGDAAAVLAAMERGRARALQLGLQDRPQPAGDADDAVQLQWLRQRWRESLAEGATERAAEWVARTRVLESELLEAHRRHRLAGEELTGPDRGADHRPFDSNALMAALGAHEALVAFHLQGTRLVASVVTRHRLQTLQWEAGALASQVQGLRFQIESVRYARAALASHAPQLQRRVTSHLQGLHRAVWQPLQAALADCSRVVIAPHRDLHYLPFGALHDGQHWLLEQLEIELTPSAAVWLAGRPSRHEPEERLLALGNDVQQLPHVATELAAVARAYGERALCLNGAAATAQALRDGAQGPHAADVLHLACHGEFRADNPAFSALHLADGALPMHELREWRLHARLVVLSACDTAQSRIAPGDELLGLVRAFMLAGAQQVLATRWAVDDEATATLMGDFHALRAGGVRASEALRRAQLKLARGGHHPFFWAAWALHGRG